MTSEPTFAQDLAFLSAHRKTLLLEGPDGGVAAVVPDFQGRVMTCAASQDAPGHGWINRDLVAAGASLPNFNPVGGADRIWLGPEGGRFSLFFQPGEENTLDRWRVPAFMDTKPFAIESAVTSEVTFTHTAEAVNASGFRFQIGFRRTLVMLSAAEAAAAVGAAAPVGAWTALRSINQITNIGSQPWTRETGALSLWILGMLKPSPRTAVIAPYQSGSGPIVNSSYFGEVPADRIKTEDGCVFFKADGRLRSKIGLSPERARPTIGSYSPDRRTLVIASFTLPEPRGEYINSLWDLAADPYAGDVSNSYNDGPDATFYELESSSPALWLQPGESAVHEHTTCCFTGDLSELQPIADSALGCDLARIARDDFWAG